MKRVVRNLLDRLESTLSTCGVMLSWIIQQHLFSPESNLDFYIVHYQMTPTQTVGLG